MKRYSHSALNDEQVNKSERNDE